jgi:hypothetical protein
MAEKSSMENLNLDSFYPNVLSKEPSVRLECFPALENYLSDVNTSLECNDLTGFIDGLLKWIEGSNFRVGNFDCYYFFFSRCLISIKIAYNGLRALEMFLDRLDSNEFERFIENGTMKMIFR